MSDIDAIAAAHAELARQAATRQQAIDEAAKATEAARLEREAAEKARG